LGFAEAAARNRSQSPQVVIEPADLLVGVLLAHPDSEGEARVLLAHFGLTVRDVLPADYPSVTADDLRRRAGEVSADSPAPLAPDIEQAMLSRTTGEVQLRDLLGGLLHVSPSSALHRSLEDRLAAAGISLSVLGSVYDKWLVDPAYHAEKGRAPVRALRDFLERELPRRPVDVPSYAPDRAGEGEDLIGIQREVDAFAYLLASKAQRPPLAVGLFGDWGSGKSFFMRAVRQRIAAIETQVAGRKQADVPFWKNLRQIEFNAWEYVRGTLWASLLDHIFGELDGQHIQLVDDRRKALVAAMDSASSRARGHTAARERLAGDVKKADKALNKAERDREQRLRQLRTHQSERLAEKLAASGRDAWVDGIATGLSGDNAAELATTLDEARNQLLRARGLLGPYWTTRRIVLATLAALVVPGIALAADALGLSPVVALLGALSATVPAITTLLRSATQWTRRRLDELADVARELEAERAAAERELDEQVEQARGQLREAAAGLAKQTAAEQDALAEAETLQDELKALTPGRVLGEFLQERSRSDDYRQHLGLLATVREDLGKLEQLVRENNESGEDPPEDAPPNRIILYIDDLDRCSPEKVVDVLEAVHLLLAFELFVVVVAVDSRWLSHALTNELHALDTYSRGGRRATPQDYLEKIFQLPFWVQPLSSAGRRSLIHGLLEGSVHAAPDKTNGGQPRADLSVGPREEEVLITMLSRRGSDPRLDAHLLALTPADLLFMESLAPLLGDTPRRVKRFVNVTQLLLALPPSLDQDPRKPPDREVVALLAAINSGVPNLAPRLFDVVEHRRTTNLLETVNALTAVPAEERERLAAWLRTRPDWSGLPLSRLETRLDVVRRLSFHRQPAPVNDRAGVN
jgi:KAP family P-loop domain